MRTAVFMAALAALLCATVAFCIQVPAPAKWLNRSKAQADAIHSFRVAMKQRNLDVLEKIMLDVSDPRSENYGNHLTVDKILDIVAPTSEVEQQVIDFFNQNGAIEVESHRDVLVVHATVEAVEKLFKSQLYNYVREDKESVTIVRSSNGYTLPEAIRPHVDFVSGIVDFPIAKRKKPARNTSSVGTVDPGNVIPATLQKLYNLPSEIKVNPKSSLCLAEFQSDSSFNYGDLAQFIQQTGCHNFNVTHVVGPFSPDSPDGESSLDVQFGGAVALGTETWFWTVSGWMYEFATDLFNAKEAPLVVSMSWGWPEPWQCAGDNAPGNCNGISSLEYVNRVNAEFLKIGARGISLLASSGDQGAPGDMNPSCDSTETPISTIFPGASPYVTSVGATMLAQATKNYQAGAQPPVCQQFECSNSTSELVCSYPDALITTGGGFSDYISRPAWQNTQVADYLKSGATLPPAKYFNQTNRGFPDVAALGHNFLVVIGGSFEPVDGTSCSSPVFAGIVSLLNSERLNNDKSPLGFLNPMLYHASESNPKIFRDLATGNNKCTEYCCNDIGYDAAKGWDPVTGLGTPQYPALLKFVQSLK